MQSVAGLGRLADHSVQLLGQRLIRLCGLDDLVVLIDRDAVGLLHGLLHLLCGFRLNLLLVIVGRRALETLGVLLLHVADGEKRDREGLQLLIVERLRLRLRSRRR